MIKLIEKLLAYMKSSHENRMQVFLLIGFFVVPAIGLLLLFLLWMAFHQ